MNEDRYSHIKRKFEFSENSLIQNEQEFNKELKLLTNEINAVKRNFMDLEKNVAKLNEELNKSVKRFEFKVLQKYVEMWQPMNFVTNEQFMKVISDNDNSVNNSIKNNGLESEKYLNAKN